MRIRTIKPEFWVSESVGRLSRDARLLFIGLWSFADDSGRGRGALPAISGALFPYDDDATKRLPSWFNELEKEGMVRRYTAEDGNTYYDIPKWLQHQKIEKPSKSRFPAFTEHSTNTPRILPDISPLDQGTGNREQGSGNEGSKDMCASPSASDSPVPSGPSAEDIYQAYPRKVAKPEALRSIAKAMKKVEPHRLLELTQAYAEARKDADPTYTPHPATWFNGQRYADDPSTWCDRKANGNHAKLPPDPDRIRGLRTTIRSIERSLHCVDPDKRPEYEKRLSDAQCELLNLTGGAR